MGTYKVYKASKDSLTEKLEEVIMAGEIEDAMGYIIRKYNLEKIEKVNVNRYKGISVASNEYTIEYKKDIVTVSNLIEELVELRNKYGDKRVMIFGNYSSESEVLEADYSKSEDVIYLSADIG